MTDQSDKKPDIPEEKKQRLDEIRRSAERLRSSKSREKEDTTTENAPEPKPANKTRSPEVVDEANPYLETEEKLYEDAEKEPAEIQLVENANEVSYEDMDLSTEAGLPTPPEKVKDNRRETSRTPVNLASELEFEYTIWNTRILNISETGAFVVCPALIHSGENITLRIWLPSGKEVDLRGEVVWTELMEGEFGLGIGFYELFENALKAGASSDKPEEAHSTGIETQSSDEKKSS